MLIEKPNIILINSIQIDTYDNFIKKLFLYSSFINETNKNGETLLHFCSFYGIIDKYYALISIGANICLTKEHNSLLHYASFSGKDHFLIVELIKAGILPNDKNKSGQSSLHFCKDDKIAYYLNLWCIRNNIDIYSLIDNDGNNVAHYAYLLGNYKTADFWIKNYPYLNEQINNDGHLWNEVSNKQQLFCI